MDNRGQVAAAAAEEVDSWRHLETAEDEEAAAGVDNHSQLICFSRLLLRRRWSSLFSDQ